MSKNNVKEIERVAENTTVAVESAVKIALVQITALERGVSGAEINTEARAARIAALRDLEIGVERAYSVVSTEINKLNGGN